MDLPENIELRDDLIRAANEAFKVSGAITKDGSPNCVQINKKGYILINLASVCGAGYRYLSSSELHKLRFLLDAMKDLDLSCANPQSYWSKTASKDMLQNWGAFLDCWASSPAGMNTEVEDEYMRFPDGKSLLSKTCEMIACLANGLEDGTEMSAKERRFWSKNLNGMVLIFDRQHKQGRALNLG